MMTQWPHNQSLGQGLHLISCKYIVMYRNRTVWS